VKSREGTTGALPPKTLVLRDVAAYLGLGSVQAAERWLKAHQVLIFQDRLGYNRAFVREIDAAQNALAAEAENAPRRLREVG
jgi:hypothetical protein